MGLTDMGSEKGFTEAQREMLTWETVQSSPGSRQQKSWEMQEEVQLDMCILRSSLSPEGWGRYENLGSWRESNKND